MRAGTAKAARARTTVVSVSASSEMVSLSKKRRKKCWRRMRGMELALGLGVEGWAWRRICMVCVLDIEASGEKATAGPSTSLRFAQDDRIFLKFGEKQELFTTTKTGQLSCMGDLHCCDEVAGYLFCVGLLD